MPRHDVLIVRTAVANLASVIAGLDRAGAVPRLTDDPREVMSAPRLVLPGVGAFGATMQRLTQTGLADAIAARVREGRPTLAICLGLQLLCNQSDESPDIAGMGVLAASASRFPPTVRIPQLGWNAVDPDRACSLLTPGHAYFANSYRLSDAPPGWAAAWSQHGGRFIAALQRGPVLACQFHPELSGTWGLELLRRWLNAAGDSPC